MIRTLVFKNRRPVEILNEIPQDINDIHNRELRWVSIRDYDDIKNILPKIMDRTQDFIDDLLEEQRPRFQEYLTLEDNDETYKVLVVRIPTTEIFVSDDHNLQISFIIISNTLFSITNKDHYYIVQIMNKLFRRKHEFDIYTLLEAILEELSEQSIHVANFIEDRIEEMEKEQLQGDIQAKKFIAKIIDLKGRIYATHKDARANLEVIRAMMQDSSFNDVRVEHLEDRVLYFIDQLDNEKAALNDVINIHLSMASHVMNTRLYWLTIVGSLLIIPTVISGIFGMNVDLPPLDFYDILILTFTLMLASALAIRWLFRGV